MKEKEEEKNKVFGKGCRMKEKRRTKEDEKRRLKMEKVEHTTNDKLTGI